MRQSLKYIFLFLTGGLLYNMLELELRGWTHWTMFILGGIWFLCLGRINEVMPWDTPFLKQVLIGACIITYLEFVTGCVVNIWLGWGIWDYSKLPGNILGQICPQFFLLWLLVSAAGIVLDDWLRYLWFHEEKPRYRLI